MGVFEVGGEALRGGRAKLFADVDAVADAYAEADADADADAATGKGMDEREGEGPREGRGTKRDYTRTNPRTAASPSAELSRTDGVRAAERSRRNTCIDARTSLTGSTDKLLRAYIYNSFTGEVHKDRA